MFRKLVLASMVAAGLGGIALTSASAAVVVHHDTVIRGPVMGHPMHPRLRCRTVTRTVWVHGRRRTVTNRVCN